MRMKTIPKGSRYKRKIEFTIDYRDQFIGLFIDGYAVDGTYFKNRKLAEDEIRGWAVEYKIDDVSDLLAAIRK